MADESKSDTRSGVSAAGKRLPSHHAAYSDSAMKADLVTLHTMNEMLQNVERHYNDGRMRAFAEHNNDVMKEFNEVRTAQEELFKRHVMLELSLVKDDPERQRDDDFHGSNYCDHLPKVFSKSERHVKDITADIGQLGVKLDKINAKVPDATQEMQRKAAKERELADAAAAAQRSAARATAAAAAAQSSRRRRGSSGGNAASVGVSTSNGGKKR